MVVNSGTTSGPELLVELDRGVPEPLHRQLANGLRDAIRTGRLVPETRLPSTRVLAADLGVSRRLVVDAYSQLAAEGFLLSRHGSGTRVAKVDAASAPRDVGEPPKQFDIDFAPGSPDLDSYPRHAWLQALRRQDKLRAVPAAAERLPLTLSPLVGVVAAKRPVACEDCAGLANQLVYNGIRAEIVGHPGHVAARPSDEAVERHRCRIEELRHRRDGSRNNTVMATVDVEVQATIARPRAVVAAYSCDPDNTTSCYANIDSAPVEIDPRSVSVTARKSPVDGFAGDCFRKRQFG